MFSVRYRTPPYPVAVEAFPSWWSAHVKNKLIKWSCVLLTVPSFGMSPGGEALWRHCSVSQQQILGGTRAPTLFDTMHWLRNNSKIPFPLNSTARCLNFNKIVPSEGLAAIGGVERPPRNFHCFCSLTMLFPWKTQFQIFIPAEVEL